VRFDDDFVAAQRDLVEDFGFASYHAALRSWIATVAIVEVGYGADWEEYVLLDLPARDYLNELMMRSPGSRAAIEEDIRAWDDRFRAATVQEEKPHLPPMEGEPGWWQYRSPRSWHRPASDELNQRAGSGTLRNIGATLAHVRLLLRRRVRRVGELLP
jgi:hypothetical protein